MTEKEKDETTPAAPAPEKKPADKPAVEHRTRTRKRSGSGKWILLLLLLLVGMAGAGYYGLQYYRKLDGRMQKLAQQQTKTQHENEQLREQLAEGLHTLSKQQSELEHNFQVLSERSHYVRKDWLVMEAEYLLQLANYRLLFERDTRTARTALGSADSRLRETGDPGLIGVRKAIAESEQALAAVPQPDLAGMSLKLSALADEVNELPLATPDPKSMQQEKKTVDKETSKVKSWSALPAAIWHDVTNLIVIRDHRQRVEPLLAPDQRFFLGENLRLQLEQARLAMLSGHPDVYKERLGKAIQWVRQFFDPESPKTKAVLDALGKLRDSDIAPALPDISKPYQMLERYRERNKVPEPGAKQGSESK